MICCDGHCNTSKLGILSVIVVMCGSPMVWATGSYVGEGFSFTTDGYNGSLASMGSSSVTVPAGEPDGDVIAGLTIDLDMHHTWVGALTIKLVGPVGMVTLMSRPGFMEPADDGTGCCGYSADLVVGNVQTFDDSAELSAEDMGMTGTPIPQQSLHPDGGVVGPMSLLETFGGTSAAGDWTLYVGSSLAADFGEVDTWSLNLLTVPEPGSLSLLGIGALAMIRRR